MNCRDIRETLPDVASGVTALTPELNEHLAHCDDCADIFAGLQSTMALLDEWKAPEPSPYFDTRLQARLREERSAAATKAVRWSWLHWLKRPVVGATATVLLVAGIGIGVGVQYTSSNKPAQPVADTVKAPHGTAVGDLQFLDKHEEVLQAYDPLDAVDGLDDDDAPSAN